MNKIEKYQVIGKSPNSKFMKDYKKSLKTLTNIQFEASIGLLLGDANLQTQNKGKTYRLRFEWGEKNKPYLDFVYSLFDEWVLSSPHKKVRKSPSGNTVVNWGFQTISHEAFNVLAKLFYPLGLSTPKGIKFNLIKEHLTARSLAFWFCDDGGKLDYNKNSKNKSVVLNTHSFSTEEVESMAKQLQEKFKLECEVRSNKGKKNNSNQVWKLHSFQKFNRSFYYPWNDL